MSTRPLLPSTSRRTEAEREAETVVKVGDNVRVGSIGLGDMGAGIASRLLSSRVPLSVFDLRPEPVAELVAQGAESAESIAELTRAVDVILVCVLNDDQLKEVFLGAHGILSAARSGQTVIVQSSVLPSTVIELAEASRAAGVHVIDCPVSGNQEDRREGTLLAMVGGPTEIVEPWLPLLETIADPVLLVGDVGAGQLAKLLNNTVMNATRVAATEVMRLADAYGMDETTVLDVWRAGSADSWVTRNWDFFDGQSLIGQPMDAPGSQRALAAAADRGLDLPLIAAIRAETSRVLGERLAKLRRRGTSIP